jgi:DNA helicase-2/ATP-dependent DNA helicase PcrA
MMEARFMNNSGVNSNIFDEHPSEMTLSKERREKLRKKYQ